MGIGDRLMAVLCTVGGALALVAWHDQEDGISRAVTALLAGFLLARGISQLVAMYVLDRKNRSDANG